MNLSQHRSTKLKDRKTLKKTMTDGHSKTVKVFFHHDFKCFKLKLLIGADFENEMDETLKAGDVDDVSKWITPHNLTKCVTNCLEKSFEVSEKLKDLANTAGPSADDLDELATSVEDFAVQMLEPLKSDDMKRTIFGGEDFDRVSDKAVRYGQKKLVSHPVVYNLLTRKWKGHFYHLRKSNSFNWFKWFFLNLWTLFDVFLFPVVYALLCLVDYVIGCVKKRQEFRIVIVLNASWKHAEAEFQTMRDISQFIMDRFKSDRIQYATIIHNHDKKMMINPFNKSEKAMTMITPDKKDEDHPTRENTNNNDGKADNVFLTYLHEADKLFKVTESPSNKVLVVMTDDKSGASTKDLLSALNKQANKVISVGFGVHPEIKELETMATNEENVFTIFMDNIKPQLDRIVKCVKGKTIFDCYVQYFETPYFIFFRDTLSYLVLLGLHFAMCLQPSTLYFTAIEWIIMVFFLGRFLMEVDQVIMERKTDGKATNQQYKRKNKEKQQESSQENERHKSKNTNEETQITKFLKMVSRYFSDWWNILDVVTLIVFVVLICLRVFAWSEHGSVSKNRVLAVAGYLYGLNAMVLTIRVFGHIMEYNKSTGSIQIALFQIIGGVFAIFFQFLAATLAFSLAITKIYIAEASYNTATNATPSGLCANQNGFHCWWSSATWLIWSLLGNAELDPLKSSDHTSDVLAKLLYGVFLIMGVVMLMNMMVALLSNTYQQVEDNAFYEWSYKKATTIRTYTRYHPVPVPFNVISLSFKLLQHICRTIKCTKCKRNRRHKPITAAAEASLDFVDVNKEQDKALIVSLFDRLVMDLQADYFAVYGYAFPMADNNKMDRLLKETDGSHQLIGHIAQRVFQYDWEEKQQLDSRGRLSWDVRGVDVVGQRLSHINCECLDFGERCENTYHGAKCETPVCEECPGFEVLIQESGERRFIAIGVVTQNYEIHKFPGWDGNTAGYHIDDGKIFDKEDSKLGRDGKDAMAHRGDLIGCKILYDQKKGDKLPVSFTLNGRVVGEATLASSEYSTDSFYPYVGIGWEGIILLFRMCPKVSSPREERQPTQLSLEDISRKLNITMQKQDYLKHEVLDGISHHYVMIMERQADLFREERQSTLHVLEEICKQFMTIREKQADLELKLDRLSRVKE